MSDKKVDLKKLNEDFLKDMDSFKVKLNELKASFTETKANGEEGEKESMPMCSMKDLFNVYNDLYSMILRYYDYAQSNLNELWKYFDKHQTGHIPPLTPSQLTEILKAAGAEKDWKIEPKVVWAKHSVTAEMVKK